MIDINRIGSYYGSLQGKATLGLDGFVDEVWQVVKGRSSRTDYVLYEKMQDFAKTVYDVGKGGFANEILRKRRSYGGCVCNTGKAAGRLGSNPTFIGMFGEETVDPVFREFQESYTLISVADPAICQIFEFTDGKLMLPFMEETLDFNWEYLINSLPKDELAKAMDSDIVSIGYWSQLTYFDELVTGLCEEFLIEGRCKRMFFDFADVRKRDKQSLERTLSVLAGLNKKMPMTLSLNEHEAGILFSYKGKSFDWEKPDEAENDIEYVRQQTGLDELVIHTPYFAVAATANEGTAKVMQRFCEDPVITTGAGDNFNGGYLSASLDAGKLNLRERLFVGNAATGFYIRNGYSPDKAELMIDMKKLIEAL